MHSSKKQRHNKKRTTRKFKGGQVYNEIKASHPGVVGPAMNIISNTTSTLASNAISSANNLLGFDITNKNIIFNDGKYFSINIFHLEHCTFWKLHYLNRII